MSMNNIQKRYSTEVKTIENRIKELRGKSRRYVVFEIASFCLAVTFFVLYCLKGLHTPYLIMAMTLMTLYVLIRRVDVLNDRKIKIMLKRHAVYSRELSYLQGDFSVFDDGTRYIDPQHPFTYDMDVFGGDSLFNRINRTVSTGGSDKLAAALGTLPSSALEVGQKRSAVDELAENDIWRTEFFARGQRLTSNGKPDGKKIDSASILHVIQEINAMPISRRFASRAALLTAFSALVGFYLTIALSVFTTLPSSVPALWSVLLLFITLGLTARPTRLMMQAVGKLHAEMRSYISLICHIQKAEFKSARLKELQNELLGNDSDALESFNMLSSFLDALDRRANILGLILFNVAFMSDFFLVRKFLRWQSLYIGQMAEWIAAVSQIDAYCSMAVLRYNHPEATEAELVSSDEVVYETEGFYHPFLGAAAVSNDFTIKDGSYYIITGANMAGKSTFLRSIGINYILAMNGMPVFANRFKVSMFNLFSSMRTTDDLSHGISYFNAELLRLRQLIESCKRHSCTLIILDEILKGTNSLDKLNGSRLFLTEITRLPVTGVIATHDLKLSKLETEQPARFRNYCFEIQLAENITYTYKISQGVARNQNATYLLHRIINDI